MNCQLLSKYRPLAARKFHVGGAVNTAKPSPLIDSIIRVDHAGELGADRIYAGQMAVLGSTKMGPLIQHMWDQEKVHKATFENLIVKHRVRPTALVPIWNVAGFLLGAGTALMGEKAAMACTVAVESVIVDHYNDQLRTLMAEPEKNKELMETIQKFRDDEQEHHDCGIDHGAEQAPFYRALSETIKLGCKAAIALSKGLFSQRNQLNTILSRTYCTSTETAPKKKWDLYSAVCLERKPLIMKPLNELEQKVAKMLYELEVERSHKSDHEIRSEEDLKNAKLRKTGINLANIKVEGIYQTAIEDEHIWNKEFEGFKFAPLTTPADGKNDVKSLDRKLSSHLLFLVNERIGDKKHWILPQGIRKDQETLRETAERILREKCGEKLNAVFLGNAPCGFYKYSYPKHLRSKAHGAKVFFFKAIYVSGNVECEETSASDYRWALRSDLPTLFDNETYYQKVAMFLIEDDEAQKKGEKKL